MRTVESSGEQISLEEIPLYQLIEKAEQNPHPLLLRWIGQQLWHKQEPDDRDKALDWFKRAGLQWDDLPSLMFLADYYRSSPAENGDETPKYLEYLTRAADLGHAPAIKQLAHYFQALFPVENASDGFQDSFENISVAQENAEDMDGVSLLLHYTSAAAEGGDPNSLMYLSTCHLKGLFGFEKNSEEALKLLMSSKSFQCRSRAAQLLLLEQDGGSTKSDKLKANEQRRKAIDLMIQNSREFGYPSLKPLADMLSAGKAMFRVLCCR
jgi:TPR repeat protein